MNARWKYSFHAERNTGIPLVASKWISLYRHTKDSSSITLLFAICTPTIAYDLSQHIPAMATGMHYNPWETSGLLTEPIPVWQFGNPGTGGSAIRPSIMPLNLSHGAVALLGHNTSRLAYRPAASTLLAPHAWEQGVSKASVRLESPRCSLNIYEHCLAVMGLRRDQTKLRMRAWPFLWLYLD
jgi:hypothetical protein